MAAMQAEREAAAQEALALRQEVERVMTRHQERVAKWEAAAASDEAQLTQRKSALEVLACSLHYFFVLLQLSGAGTLADHLLGCKECILEV
jgi:hypothetical protein